MAASACTGRSGTDACVGESFANLDGAGGARRSELNDAKGVVGRIVHVEVEAELILVEPQRTINVAYRYGNHFDGKG